MTAIAAVRDRGRVYMACDSRVSDDTFSIEQGAPKYFRAGEVLIGLAGDGSAERIVPAIDWTRGDWTAQIKKKQDEFGASADFDLLIATARALFVYSHGCVFVTAERYTAVGEGSPVCLGYLAGTAGVPAMDRVRGAVRAAIKHVPSCGGKIWSVRV